MKDYVIERIRREPSPFSVPGSLPVVAFGDMVGAIVATVGLNPSDKEYLDREGVELTGSKRRFETLNSLGAADRQSLSQHQCEVALDRMGCYFQPSKPVYSWFRSLDRVLQGYGVRYSAGEAVHLDLVQEATSPTWSALAAQHPCVAQELRDSDLPFLQEQIRRSNYEVIICNGRTVFETVLDLLSGRLHRTDLFGTRKQLKVYEASASVDGRTRRVLGWNLPLARAGLTIQDDFELGRLLLEGLTSPPGIR